MSEPRILIVGAGAVGLVYAHALIRAGAEVSFFVRARRVEETRAGTTLTHVGLLGKRVASRVVPHEVLSTWDEVRCRGFDQIWVAVPTDALDDALIGELASARSHAAVVSLSPGSHVDELFAKHVPRASLVRGSIAFMCWHAPMEGSSDPRETGTARGWGCLVPPGRGAGFSGERAGEVVSLLGRGRFPAHVDPHIDRTLAFDTASLMSVVLALEAAGWSFREVARTELAGLAVRAAHEAMEIEARREQVAVPLIARLLLRTFPLRLLLHVAPWLAPVDLERFFRAHFLKVRAQTRLLVDEIADEGARLGLPSGELKELVRRADG